MIPNITKLLTGCLLLSFLCGCSMLVSEKEVSDGVQQFKFNDKVNENEIAVYLISPNCFCRPDIKYEILVNGAKHSVQVRYHHYFVIKRPEGHIKNFKFRYVDRVLPDDVGWEDEAFTIPDDSNRVFLLFNNLRVEQIQKNEAIEEIVEAGLIEKALLKRVNN
jgi:hypothetical protein